MVQKSLEWNRNRMEKRVKKWKKNIIAYYFKIFDCDTKMWNNELH